MPKVAERDIQNAIHHGDYRVGYLYAKGMITGCGIMQIHGLKDVLSPRFKDDLDKLKAELEINAVGEKWPSPLPCKTLIGTLGTMYGKEYVDKLLEYGFKEIADYENAAHRNRKDRQKLFILTW